MIKKILLGFVIILTLATIGLVIFSSKKKQNNVSPIPEKTSLEKSNSTESSKLKEYKDPSGFQFMYPENLVIKTIDRNDQSIISDLNIGSPGKNGNITIEVSESQIKSYSEWLKKNKEASPSGNVKNIKFADLDAKQFKMDDKVITLAFDVNTQFKITLDPKNNDEFWKKINDNLISSLKFSQPENQNGDVVFEGEETIE